MTKSIKYCPFLALLIVLNSAAAQSINEPNQLLSALDNIDQNPLELVVSNNHEVNNTGGHLQGIQHVYHNKNDYYILSGSSSEYSYYSIVKTGEQNMVISINKLLDKPFKHAGGFQIHENLMAIGVEDNNAKNISKVFIFHIANPEKPSKNPLAIIDRMGTFERATAGCVAITTINGKVLVVVGDWNTEHLDFYRIDREKLNKKGATLELEYSISAKKQVKTSWIDDKWLSYQNINFIQDLSQNLYLAGMTSNEKDQNIIDLYLVSSEALSTFHLTKIYTRILPQNKKTKFRWGAGIQSTSDGEIKILSCGDNLNKKSIIHVYQ